MKPIAETTMTINTANRLCVSTLFNGVAGRLATKNGDEAGRATAPY